jgi:hypothetical protein
MVTGKSTEAYEVQPLRSILIQALIGKHDIIGDNSKKKMSVNSQWYSHMWISSN